MLADEVSCRACGSGARPTVVGEVAPTHPGPFHRDSFRLLHCADCDVVYLDPAPVPDDLRTLYEVGTQFDDAVYTDPSRVSEILAYLESAARRHDLLPAGGRLLEVGAGLAWMSRVAKKLERNVTTCAQDVTTEARDACPWVDHFHIGPLSTLGAGSFDTVSMTHVIEHVVEPRSVLADVSSRLTRGGKIFVTAPYRPKGWQPDQGLVPWLEYSYLHIPAHIHYFSERWFQMEAPRHGLKVTHWESFHDDHQAFELLLVRE
jgi:SAM-dependent methyltransferase